MSENNYSRLSFDQVKAIVDFMGQHSDLASGHMRTTEARHTSKQLWKELTKILHKFRGARKTPEGWSKYFSDLKCKLKTKLLYLDKLKRTGQTKPGVKQLTKLEKRLMTILGPDFAKIKDREQNSCQNSNHKLAEIKLEAPSNTVFCNTLSEGYNRLSDTEEHDIDITEEALDDDWPESPNDRASSPNERPSTPIDSILENVCPKWLIDVEKKRAKAELIRARAEEQKAAVAAKNAEAALIQAQALRTLSEAASTQADAIMRIAILLESRTTRDILAV